MRACAQRDEGTGESERGALFRGVNFRGSDRGGGVNFAPRADVLLNGRRLVTGQCVSSRDLYAWSRSELWRGVCFDIFIDLWILRIFM